MNKGELVAAIAEKSGLSKKDSEAALNATVASIEEALKSGDSVQLVGFGSFVVKDVAAKQARVPGTTKTVNVHAKKAPKFVAGKGLKDCVNSK
jgi:DNA-binding protein HU-beta